MNVVFGIIGLAIGLAAGFFLAQNRGKQALEQAKASHSKATEKLKKQHERRLEDSTTDFQQRLQKVERERDSRIEAIEQDYQGQLDTLNQQLESTETSSERIQAAEKRAQDLQVHNDTLVAQNQQLAEAKANLEARVRALESQPSTGGDLPAAAPPEPAGLGDEFDALFTEISELAPGESALPEMEAPPAPPAPGSDLDAGMDLQDLDALLGESPSVAAAEVNSGTPEAAAAPSGSSADVDISQQLDELDALLSDDLGGLDNEDVTVLDIDEPNDRAKDNKADDDFESLFDMFPEENDGKQS